MFFEESDDGCVPSCGMQSVADGTVRSIGHLIAATVCSGGPGPGFLAPWVYFYLVSGTTELNNHMPDKLHKNAEYYNLHTQVK